MALYCWNLSQDMDDWCFLEVKSKNEVASLLCAKAKLLQ